MSLWPKLRKRSKGRKRLSGKANPYASRDNDKYALVHAQLEAERAKFAAEKGVPISVVRFVSRSSRGWVSLPQVRISLPSPTSAPETPVTIEGCRVRRASLSEISGDFSLPPPALPLPTTTDGGNRSAGERIGELSGSEEGGLALRETSNGNSSGRNSGRLVVSSTLNNEAWTRMRRTAAVVFVKVLVVSHALEANKAIALTIAVVVDIWSRGKSNFQRVFSALAAQLLTSAQPRLPLQRQGSSTSHTRTVQPAQSSPVLEMKVAPVNEISDDQGSNRSTTSFTFPQGVNSSPMRSPVFPNQQQQQRNESPSETISLAGSPLMEINKSSPRKCQSLKSKLFKGGQAGRKDISSVNENSVLSSENADSIDIAPASSSAPSSPSRAKGKHMSAFRRRISNKGPEGESEESDASPPTSTKMTKISSRSHESIIMRSPINERLESTSTPSNPIAIPGAVPSQSGKNVSRSQELRSALKSLGRRKSSLSSELSTSPPPPTNEELTLPSSTVEELEAMAFPFKEEKPSTSPPRPRCIFRSSPPRQDAVPNRQSNGKAPKGVGSSTTTSSGKSPIRSMSWNSDPEENRVEEIVPVKLRRLKTDVTHSCPPDPQIAQLRKVKTSVPSRSPPLPTQSGELGRSLLSREHLGALLLITILGFLQLGRIPAILATSCLCLVLSGLQRFAFRNMTERDRQKLRRSMGESNPRGQLPGAASGSPSWAGTSNRGSAFGSPVHEKSGLQSSEYRKRVLIEGFLDRGNRRGATP